MIKESRYILRRILIGVGIVLCLSFLNGCKVKAWSFTNNYRSKTKSSIINNSDIVELKTYNYITFYQNQVNKSVYFCASYSNTCYEMYFTNNNFQYENIGLLISSPSSSSNSTIYRSCAYMSETTLPKFNHSDSWSWNYANYSSNTYIFCVFSRNSDNSYNIAMYGNANNENGEAFYGGNINPSKSSSNYQWYSNINWNYYGNLKVSDDNIIGVSIPEFISFNAIPITTDNVITSYTIQPEFSSFDTENYVYQYSFDNKRWLSLTENKHILRINNNSSIYVRFKDKKTNEIIDSANLTITNIGTFYNKQTYNINFSGDYRTENYLNDNISSKSQSIIVEYQVYIDYLPKSSLLTYQYQYVKNGDSLDNNNWENVPTSDNGSITYVATENGTLFARILDKNNNILKTNTFTVNSIGNLALDNSNVNFNDFYSSLRNKINFGGPIGSLVNIPITLLQTISDAFVGGTGICTDYPLGNLWGSNLVIPCVNIKKHLGNDLYNIIDIICSCTMFYMIVKMLTNAYYRFLLMEHTPVNEHIGRDY